MNTRRGDNERSGTPAPAHVSLLDSKTKEMKTRFDELCTISESGTRKRLDSTDNTDLRVLSTLSMASEENREEQNTVDVPPESAPEGAVQKEIAALHGTDADAPDGADPDAEEDKDRQQKKAARKEKRHRESADADAPDGADPDAEEDKDRQQKKAVSKESVKGKPSLFFPVCRCCGSSMAILFPTNQ